MIHEILGRFQRPRMTSYFSHNDELINTNKQLEFRSTKIKIRFFPFKTKYMTKIKIGLAGLGVVGQGVYEILTKDKALIDARTKNQLELVAVASRSKKDFIDTSKIKVYENTIELARDKNIDVVVEVIGGNTISKQLFEESIANGKKYVTANKALLAEHGFDLAKLVEEKNSYVGFEASVAGATPIIKAFKEGFAGNKITEFYAILNGTCNFILTKMQKENLDFAVALKQAQELGYAEADPTFDIKGIDTAHKLVILAAIASGTKPAFSKTFVEGVDEVGIDDINLADELGYKIKLLAIYKSLNHQQTVYPSLIKKEEKIAQVDGPFNAILTNASNAGFSFIAGSGAGRFPTASAVVSDLVDIANERYSPVFGINAKDLKDADVSSIESRIGAYFLNLTIDKKAAQNSNLAEKIFANKLTINKAHFIDRGDEILCGFVTSSTQEKTILEIVKNLDSGLVKKVKFLRVEEINSF